MTTPHLRSRRSVTTAALVLLLLGHHAMRAQTQNVLSIPAPTLTVEYEIGSFASAVSLSVNAAGELVVLDAGADAVIRLGADGTELSRLQGRGFGSNEFDSPTDVSAAFPLAVFVSDGKNHRVQQFDKELHFVQTIGAMDEQAGTVQQATAGIQLLQPSFRPIAAVESPQGELFVVDADANRVVKFTTRLQPDREFGTYASGEGRLDSPSDICITDDGRVAVADRSRIVFFDQFGNYLYTHAAADSAMTVRALSSNEGDVIAVDSNAIAVIGALPSSSKEKAIIRKSMVVGSVVGEFRDAARTSQWWYLLTPKAILVCRRTEN